MAHRAVADVTTDTALVMCSTQSVYGTRELVAAGFRRRAAS